MIDLATTRKSTRWGLVLAALVLPLLAGCDMFPRDPENTLEKVTARGIVRVGIEQPIPDEASNLLGRIERATGATVQISQGGVEPLLGELDAGKIDMVIAPFRKKTPWAAQAALSPPLRIDGSGENATEWRAAMRSGENRWIMLVETNASHASSAPGAS